RHASRRGGVLDWHEARRALNCRPPAGATGGPWFIGVRHINRNERGRGPGVTPDPPAIGPAPSLVAGAPVVRAGLGPAVAWVAATLLLLAAVAPAAAEPKRVLLLHSLGREFAPFADVSGRFREELIRQSTDPVDYYEISLETARFAGAD